MTSTPTTMPLHDDSSSITVRRPRFLTLAEFRRKYADREDGFKYEYNQGIIEKYLGNMNIKQYHIVKNLTRRFTQTAAYVQGAELGIEVEQLTAADKMRRPDLCLIPSQKLADTDESISEFVIEITSPTDKADDIQRKRREYFQAGVQVLWQVDPADQSVSVFTAPTLVKICEGNSICSAMPVLTDFEMTAADIFKK